MWVFVEMRLQIELLKKLLKKEPVDDLMPFSDLKPMTDRYVHQVMAERMGSNYYDIQQAS